ncbi:hypothetical protein SLS55_004605 [Diplodia seriata]|uniref:BTB domain-containing protein n=1 Tax=Diplodia seriata TaxID=420778 RepID=A0ABR3CJV3_9PEZI
MAQPYNFDGHHNARVQRASLYDFSCLANGLHTDTNTTSITGETITVIIGSGSSSSNGGAEEEDEAGRSFTIHRALICAFSPFFAAACRGPWKESRSGIIKLPDADPVTFDLYVKWLYTGELVDHWRTASSDNEQVTDATSAAANDGLDDHDQESGGRDIAVAPDSVHTAYTVFVHAYILGDALLDSAFKNAAVDALIKRVHETNCYPCALAALIYTNTSGSASPLRRLLVDFYAYAYKREWFVGGDRSLDMEDGPREFFRDVLVKVVKVKEIEEPDEFPWMLDACQYHDHPDGVICDGGATSMAVVKGGVPRDGTDGSTV